MVKRVYHTWDQWECYPAGFYDPKPPRGMTVPECKTAYRNFLADLTRFSKALDRVLAEWPNSSEHYLSNERMNRIAWLGQASMCIETRVSKFFCGGYFLLPEGKREAADLCALEALNKWLATRREAPLTLQEAASKTQADLY